MTDFKAKMHQIRFRLGDPLVGFGGPTSKEREREGRAGEGRGKEEGEGREEREGEGRERGMSPPLFGGSLRL